MIMSNTITNGLSLLVCALSIAACSPDDTSKNSTSTDTTATPPSSVAESKPQQVTIDLGTETTLKVLYSYPNSPSSDESLADTIEHYLNQRLQRDTIGNASASVSINSDGDYEATLSGNDDNISDYQSQISTFLANGELAAKAVVELKNKKLWNEDEWRFFLPLGLSIVNQRSVQLLHFPPDYSLPEQNYLDSKTSQRWEKLLVLNEVAADDVTLYESILDVAPIAAPASAGSTLSKTYSAFEPYVVNMLPLLLDIDEGNSNALPIVAYGGPVRSWVKSYFEIENFGVNSFDTVTIDNVAAPILGANHPSYIWYTKDQGRAAAMNVMQEDLISACWQAKMGATPSLDGASTLANCSSYWQERPMTVCINMEIQAFDQTEEEAKKSCKDDLPDLAESNDKQSTEVQI